MDDTLKPDQVVGELPKESKVEETPEIDEYEQSAAFIHHYHKVFRRIGYDLANRKKKAPIRVLEALLFNPLHDVELLGKAELDLLKLSGQVLYHKGKLMEYAEKRKQEKTNNTQGVNNEQSE